MKYAVTSDFKQYLTFTDRTNAPANVLVVGSKNVLINDEEKVRTREGYTIFGASATGLNPVLSSYDWFTSTATTLNLRKFNTSLQFYSNLK